MATEETPAETSDKRIKPHHLALGLAYGIAAFTAISGITPLITEWHDESPIVREVFFNIPSESPPAPSSTAPSCSPSG